jgi:hypothetical protein
MNSITPKFAMKMGGIWFWYSPNYTHIIPYHDDLFINFENLLRKKTLCEIKLKK